MVYVAVALAVLVGVERATGVDATKQVVLVGLSIPMVLIALSAVLLRPGPGRDWMVHFFFSLMLFVPAFFSTLPLLFQIGLVVVRAGGRRDWSGIGFVGFYALVFWGAFLFISRARLTVRPCPRCGRRGLVWALAQQERRWKKAWYYRCTVCDQVCRSLDEIRPATSLRDLGRPSMSPPACPHCGTETLRKVPYAFFWCLSCGSRSKQAYGGPWEEAGLSEDDGFYWLWRLDGGLSGIGRWLNGRRGRSDPPH